MNTLATNVIAIALYASSNAFMYYTSGVVSSGCALPSDGIDHAVTAVGWGVDSVAGNYVLI